MLIQIFIALFALGVSSSAAGEVRTARVPVPPEFPADHGVPRALSLPSHVEKRIQVRLPEGRSLFLYPALGQHWITMPAEDGAHPMYWGPMTTAQLVKFGLLAKVKEIWSPEQDSHRYNFWYDAQNAAPILLGASDTPLSALGLYIANTRYIANGDREDLVDKIRELRLKLLSEGLAAEMASALKRLTADEPPLPPAAEFTAVNTSAQLPVGFDDSLWGPVDEGLCAAAVLPKEIPLNTFVPVRFFVKNVSEHPLYLTVSNVGTFNHPEVTDANGPPMKRKLPAIYYGIASSAAKPLPYPSGPWAPMTRIVLAPGVVYELEPSYLHWELEKPPIDKRYRADLDRKLSLGTTCIYGPVGEVTITWKLRTTAGRQTDRKAPWPTKGCWSGVPQSTAQRVQLKL